MTRVTTTDRCEARLSRCRCQREPHSGDVHDCACGGSWKGSGDDVTILSYPSVVQPPDEDAGGEDEAPVELPEGVNREQFARALSMGFDPFMAAICASPPVKCDRGGIVYRYSDGTPCS